MKVIGKTDFQKIVAGAKGESLKETENYEVTKDGITQGFWISDPAELMLFQIRGLATIIDQGRSRDDSKNIQREHS